MDTTRKNPTSVHPSGGKGRLEVADIKQQTRPNQVWVLLNLDQQQLLERTLVIICCNLVKGLNSKPRIEEVSDEQG